MSQRSYQRYTPEFKEQALGLLALGKPVSEVARELQVSDNLLYSWRSQSKRTEREIALMQEYRACLTTDIITGKLDVREAANRLPEPADQPTVDGAIDENEADI